MQITRGLGATEIAKALGIWPGESSIGCCKLVGDSLLARAKGLSGVHSAGDFIARGTSLSFAFSRDTHHSRHVHYTRRDGTPGGDIRRHQTPDGDVHDAQIPDGTHGDQTPDGDVRVAQIPDDNHRDQIPDHTHHDHTHPLGRRSDHSHEQMRSTLSPP